MAKAKSVQELNTKYYAQNAEKFDTTYWRGDERNITEHFFRKPGKLLIAGVGRGRTVPHLADRGHEVTGIDIVPEMIEGAKQYKGDFKVIWICLTLRSLTRHSTMCFHRSTQ